MVMTKIGDKTSQLSVRIDTNDAERIDKIRKLIKKKTGIEPRRSDVVRLVLLSGIEAHEKKLETEKGGAR